MTAYLVTSSTLSSTEVSSLSDNCGISGQRHLHLNCNHLAHYIHVLLFLLSSSSTTAFRCSKPSLSILKGNYTVKNIIKILHHINKKCKTNKNFHKSSNNTINCKKKITQLVRWGVLHPNAKKCHAPSNAVNRKLSWTRAIIL